MQVERVGRLLDEAESAPSSLAAERLYAVVGGVFLVVLASQDFDGYVTGLVDLEQAGVDGGG